MSSKTEIRQGGLNEGLVVTLSDMCPDTVRKYFKPGMEVDVSREGYDILCAIHRARQHTWMQVVERLCHNIHMAIAQAKKDNVDPADLEGVGVGYELPGGQVLMLMCKVCRMDDLWVIIVMTPDEYDFMGMIHDMLKPFSEMASVEEN